MGDVDVRENNFEEAAHLFFCTCEILTSLNALAGSEPGDDV